MDSSIHNAGSSINNSNVGKGEGSKKTNEFIIDETEYMQVFKIFDKKEEGVINIGQVYELINKFDDTSLRNNGGSNLNLNSQGGGNGAHGNGPGQNRSGMRSNNYGLSNSKNNNQNGSAYSNSKNNQQNFHSKNYKGNSSNNEIIDQNGGMKYNSRGKNQSLSGKTA